MDETQAAKRVAQLLPDIAKLLRLFGAQMTTAITSCSTGETRVLLYLFHHPCATLGEVAAGTGVALPTASEAVDRLVGAGFVERETDPRDRRRVVLRLTPGAHETAERLHAALLELVRATLAQLDPEEWPVFVRSLEVLAGELRSRLPATGRTATDGALLDRK